MDAEEEIYKRYMARNLRMLTENTAALSHGTYMAAWYDDIIDGDREPEDDRTPEDIIDALTKKIENME